MDKKVEKLTIVRIAADAIGADELIMMHERLVERYMRTTDPTEDEWLLKALAMIETLLAHLSSDPCGKKEDV